MSRLSSEGSSANWNAYKSKVLTCFNENFRPHLAESGEVIPPFDELAEGVLCDQKIHEQFAHYLANLHVIAQGNVNAGDHLAPGTSLEYLSTLINMARVKFVTGKDCLQRSRDFMTCLNYKSATPDCTWLLGLRRNIRAIAMERIRKGEQKADQASKSIYPNDTKTINLAYSRAGTKEAAVRKFAILTCSQTCGRSAETSLLAYHCLIWDSCFNAVFGTSAQPKTLKEKYICLHAGRYRWNDWFLNFGDFLVLNRPAVDDEPYLFDEMLNSSSPGTLLSRYLQGVVTNAQYALQKYKAVFVPWPSDPVAGGMRRGGINCCYAVMPFEFVLPFSGHSLREWTAMGEYIDAERASLIPSATAVADYPPRTYGTVGHGPQPATLDALLDLNVDLSALDAVVVALFQIDSAFPVQLKPCGELWPALRCSLASFIMYYPERVRYEEMVVVQTRLLEVVMQVFHCQDPNERILEWAVAIRKKFDVDNLQNVTGPDGGGGNQAAIVNLMQEMNSSVLKQNAVLDRVCAKVDNVCSRLDDLDEKQDELQRLVLLLGNQQLAQSSGPDQSGSEVGSESQSSTSLQATSPTSHSPSPSASSALSSPAASSPTVSSPMNALKKLRAYNSVDSIPRTYSLGGIKCAEFYMHYVDLNFTYPSFISSAGKNCCGSLSRAKKVVQYFEWMLSDEESIRVRAPNADKGELRALFPKIEGLFLAFLAHLFQKYTKRIPKTLKISATARTRVLSLSPCGLEERLKELTKISSQLKTGFREIDLQRDVLQNFRREMDPQAYDEIMSSGSQKKRLRLGN